jgi:hypothetical protein
MPVKSMVVAPPPLEVSNYQCKNALGIFVLKCKKKQYKKGKHVGFFSKRGGGRALRLQVPVISTIYILY